MPRRPDDGSSDIAAGMNTALCHDGREYHVQTQCSQRGAPVIESLVFQGGQTLVRMTASYDDIARRFGFSGDDGRHLLELQHADLIRKIRSGMLRDADDDEAESVVVVQASPARLADTTDDPSEFDEPAVRELLQELDAALELSRPQGDASAGPTAQDRPPDRRPKPEPAAQPAPGGSTAYRARTPTAPAHRGEAAVRTASPGSEPRHRAAPDARRRRRPWWRRFVICLRFPF